VSGQEAAMEERTLTREEIALSILNGLLGSLAGHGGEAPWWERPEEADGKASQGACTAAFAIADRFIRERSR
jgi:hypothetical protein